MALDPGDLPFDLATRNLQETGPCTFAFFLYRPSSASVCLTYNDTAFNNEKRMAQRR